MYCLDKVYDYLFDHNPLYSKSSIEFLHLADMADGGDVNALFKLGRCFETGSGVQKDMGAALSAYAEASEKGDAEATGFLGDFYYYGKAIRKDYKKAMEYYTRALKMMRPYKKYPYISRSLTNMGDCFFKGYGVERDEKKAIKYYKMAGDYAPAQYRLGFCYEMGIGLQKNEKKAAEFYRKAADKFYAEAYMRLGNMLMADKGADRNPEEAYRCYSEAANLGHVDAKNNMAVCLLKGMGVKRDVSRAFVLFKDAAEHGSAAAENHMGLCYQRGIGVEKDEKKAFEIYKENARYVFDGEDGDAAAMYFLGMCFAKGIGTTENCAMAEKWYKKSAKAGYAKAEDAAKWISLFADIVPEKIEKLKEAAEAGNDAAMCELADCYFNEDGVERDYYMAYTWYAKAAEAGNSYAQVMLGECYEYEYGVYEDDEKAYYWYAKAAEAGDARGLYEIAMCQSRGSYGYEKDESAAREKMILSAEKGYHLAQYHLGDWYATGFIFEKDMDKAKVWFEKSALQGDPYAMSKLSKIYYDEDDFIHSVEWYEKMEKNDRVAMTWISDAYYRAGLIYESEMEFEKAFLCYHNSAGNSYRDKEYEYAVKMLTYNYSDERSNSSACPNYARAMRKLGDFYLFGRGCYRSLVWAAEWYRRAKENGDIGAEINLETSILWKD